MTLWRMRYYRWIYEWKVEQAAELGWVRIFFRESLRGPAAGMAELSGNTDAKLPRFRRQIEKEISRKLEVFARRSVFKCIPRGMENYRFHLPPIYVAYLRCYSKALSKAVARAAAARLMRRRHVQAARAWYYARVCQEIPQAEPMPRTVSGIRARFTEVGSYRARTF